MGNPTDELRARLNELGVEYEAFRDVKYRCITKWRTYHGAFVFFAVEKEGKLFVETASDTSHSAICTPEQAIAATVGAGTCKRVYHPNRITKTCTCSNCGYGASDERWAYCPKCGHKYVHGEVEEQWKRVGRKVAE